MMEINSSYIPHRKQIEAHCAAEQFVGFGGAMGGGKTRWLCEMAKFLSLKFPNNFGLVARQSGPALAASTMEVFFSEVLIPGSAEWNALGCTFSKSDGYLTFNALSPPSRIWFTGLDRDNTERVKSLNLGFFCIDEATEVSEGSFMMLQTRLRRKHIPQIYRKGMISANPEAGWVKRKFIDQKIANYRFIFSNFEDNPHLPDDYPQLFRGMPERWRQKYLYGKWDAVSGLIWKEFVPPFHVIPKPEMGLPAEWKRVRGMDHGQQNKTACVGIALGREARHDLEWLLGPERIAAIDSAYDHYPFLFVERMYYKNGLVHAHKEGIARIFPEEFYQRATTYIDPSTRARDRQKQVIKADGRPQYIDYSIFEEYTELPNRIRNLAIANNEVLLGLDRVSLLLQIGHLFFIDDPSLWPLIGEGAEDGTRSGGEIQDYVWKEPKKEEQDWPEEPLKQNDHACDALRYVVMSQEKPKPAVVKLPWNSFNEVRKRALSWRKDRQLAGREWEMRKGQMRLVGGTDA